MSSSQEMIGVDCPRCGEAYAQWQSTDSSSLASSACPHCGHDPSTDRLIHEDGVWSLAAEEEERAER